MKQKILPFLFICVIVLFSVPSVPALADEGSGVRFYTTESVDGYFSGSIGSTSEEDIASYIYIVPNSFVTSDIVSALNNFPSDPNNGNTSPLTSGYWFVCVNSQLNSMTVYWPLERYNNIDIDWSSGNPVLTANASGYIAFNACFSQAPSTTCYMMQSSYNFNTHLWSAPVGYTMTTLSDQENIFNFRITNLVNNHILSCSDTLNYLYSETQYAQESQSSSIIYYDFIHSVYTNEYNYVNFLPASLPYYDGNDIVVPDDGLTEETNENHMYFNSCDVGFCEPYGVNNFATFGGAYFYVKYSVDDWILDHINEYDIYFSSTAFVGSRQYNGSKRLSVDQDGCITIPFSDIFTTDGGVVTNGFISAVSSKVVDQRFYKTYLYSIAGEKLQNFIDKQNSVGGSFSNAWDELVHVARETYFFVYNGDNNFSEVIQDVVQSQIVSLSTVYKNYKINVNLYLVDNDGNRSGSIGRMFDLYTGSDTSTDNQGLENENPYTDDNDDYLPDVPEETEVVQTSGSGTGVNIYNMTPNQIKLTIDNGLKDFVSWYNTDASVGNAAHSFWNNMGIFKDNPASSLYEQYFGFLPADFKDLIFGACGIGIVGGAFCILRKKLT